MSARESAAAWTIIALALSAGLHGSDSARRSEDVGSLARQAGAVSGVVRDASSGIAVGAAVVSLHGSDSQPSDRRAFTTASGRFVFTGLADGAYMLTAAKDGYFDGGYGQVQVREVPYSSVVVRNGEWVSNADITLWKAGSISGRIVDDSGAPAGGIFVRSILHGRISGEDQLIGGPVAVTDDRGEYCLNYLGPGAYDVIVPVRPTIDVARARTRLPAGPIGPAGFSVSGALALHARPANGTEELSPGGSVHLEPGQEISGVDFVLQHAVPGDIEGVVRGGAEERYVRLVPRALEHLGLSADVAVAKTRGGRFDFRGVNPGAYVVDVASIAAGFVIQGSNVDSSYGYTLPSLLPARDAGGIDRFLIRSAQPGTFLEVKDFRNPAFARVPVEVEPGKTIKMSIALQQGAMLFGVLRSDDTKPSTKPSSRDVILEAASATGWGGRLSPRQGESASGFEFPAVAPGKYHLRSIGRWLVRSVSIAGIDYTNQPIELSAGETIRGAVITLTTAGAVVSGTVKMPGLEDGLGPPAVFLFTSSSGRWTGYGLNPEDIRAVLANSKGEYTIERLPGGKYYVVALRGANLTSWQAPGFFQTTAPGATEISLGWGEQRRLDLGLVSR